MFTGIIEETGSIRQISRGSKSVKLTIEASLVLEDTRVGDSISTNGICLTVVEMDGRSFTVDVMAETLRRTSLNRLTTGSRVNLERALRLSDRLGGHLLSGHVDGLGVIREITTEDIARVINIDTTPDLLRYIVAKGSIAIDGISLTVVAVDERAFSVSIIPHTATVTTLLDKQPGDAVNLETDMIAKYVEKLLFSKNDLPRKDIEQGLDLQFLSENGFI
ncbi:MAG: riboflavin synthase [Bacteroidales bacterium]|nr:riboflavin synthase [Bacteroidales bacterium]